MLKLNQTWTYVIHKIIKNLVIFKTIFDVGSLRPKNLIIKYRITRGGVLMFKSKIFTNCIENCNHKTDFKMRVARRLFERGFRGHPPSSKNLNIEPPALDKATTPAWMIICFMHRQIIIIYKQLTLLFLFRNHFDINFFLHVVSVNIDIWFFRTPNAKTLNS